jgi:hypothetical protein
MFVSQYSPHTLFNHPRTAANQMFLLAHTGLPVLSESIVHSGVLSVPKWFLAASARCWSSIAPGGKPPIPTQPPPQHTRLCLHLLQRSSWIAGTATTGGALRTLLRLGSMHDGRRLGLRSVGKSCVSRCGCMGVMRRWVLGIIWGAISFAGGR